jgi:phage terminase large subunit GpA-like protein
MDRVWAVKGSSWAKVGDPVWPKQSPDESRRRRIGFKPVIINVNAAKEFLFHNIASVLDPGPRYFHIPVERSDEWLDQLTAERQVPVSKGGGFIGYEWRLPKGYTNEAFDTLIYAYGALCGLEDVTRLNLDRQVDLVELFAHGRNSTLRDDPPPSPSPPAAPTSPVAPLARAHRPTRVRRSMWMTAPPP